MLKATNISAAYGPVPILTGVHLNVGQGEIVALLGRNGVGKTTLMRTLIGILRPSDGRVEFDGVDITGGPPHRTARLGMAYVPQGRGIFPKLTVRENLIAGTRARADRRQHIPPAVLQYFPVLRDRADQLGGTLS